MAHSIRRMLLTAGISLLVGSIAAARVMTALVDAGFSPSGVAVLTYVAWIIPALVSAAVVTLVWWARERRRQTPTTADPVASGPGVDPEQAPGPGSA